MTVLHRVSSATVFLMTLLCVCAAHFSSRAQTTVPFTHIIIDSHGPTDPWGKAVGDINGDGKIDLVVGGNTAGGLVWYQNPTWVKHVISTAVGFRTDLQVVDVDRDGLNDIVALAADADQNPLIGWYKNPGATGAWTLTVIEPFRALHDAKIADLNGDGKIDVVARDQQVFSTHHGDTIHVYLQITPASWNHISFPCVNGEGLRVADVNGDGKPDIIISGTWYENSGTGTTWTAHPYTTTYTYTSVTVDLADVNGDGRPDIILEPAEPVGSTYRASWFEAPADPRQPGWSEHIIESNIETDHHFVGAADFNNDGLMDIASAEQTTGSYPHQVMVFLNAGGGLTWKKEVFDSAGSHNDRIADIFGDGNMDIFGANWLGNKVDLYVNHSKPRAPVAKQATQVTATGFHAEWSFIRGATDYRLDVATDTAFLSVVGVYNNFAVTDTGQTVGSLVGGRTYYYRVRSETANGASLNSNRVSVTTLPSVPPPPPVAQTASGITSGGFTAHWDSSATATGYRLDVATDSLFGSGVVKNDTSVGNVLAVPITGLSPGFTYYYRVRATNSGGTSGNSNRISVTTPPNPPIAPVARAASNITSGGFTAHWDSSAGTTGYRVDVATDSLFGSGLIKNDTAVGNVLLLPLAGLAPGTIYYYRVRATNAGGTSANSNRISVATLPLAPSPPLAGGATAITSSGFTADWSASAGATGYRIDVATDSLFGSGFVKNDSAVANSLTASITGLIPATLYYYRVRATNSGGTSPNSNRITVATLPLPPAPPVAKPATQITASGFHANWSPAAGATGYRFDVSTDIVFGSLTGVYNNLGVPDTGFAVSSLSPGTTYYYRVRAENSGGTSVNSATVTLITIPPAPVATTGSSVSKTGFTAAWNSSTGATGYRLDVASDSLFVTGLVETDSSAGNALSASVTGLSAGTVFYYRVRAFNLSGTSANSNRVVVTTLPNPPPAPVARSATGITGSGFTAHWDSSATATGYRLDVATDSLFGSGAVKNDTAVGNVLAVPITGLSPGFTYYYRVRATNSGGTGGSSNRISVTTVPNPPGIPPTKFATQVTTTGFRANWGAVSGATGYRLDVSTSNTFSSFVGTFDNFAVQDTGQAVGSLSAGTVYFYRVRAENAGGAGGNSAIITASTVTLPPVATPATGVSTRGFTATWNPAAGATGYRVDIATDSLFSGGTIWADSAFGNVLAAGITGLSPATTYYYRVRGTDNGGTSISSNRISVTTLTLSVNLRVFLQGATLNDTMQTFLKRGNLIPHLQPYGVPPWNYGGADSVGKMPDSTVDWILVELRSDSAKPVARRAALLKSTGVVTDTDGVSPLRFSGPVEGSYFVVVYHRNHLAVMSRGAISLNGASSMYDFSTGLVQAFGSTPMILVGSRWCMFAGDANDDGQITTLDFSPWLANAKAALTGYMSTDFNCDGQNTTSDFTLWLANAKAAAQTRVP
jgi:phosphodiesterase/alkaline phosphatase D-like protein